MHGQQNIKTWLISSSQSSEGVAGICIFSLHVKGHDLFVECGMHRSKKDFERKS